MGFNRCPSGTGSVEYALTEYRAPDFARILHTQAASVEDVLKNTELQSKEVAPAAAAVAEAPKAPKELVATNPLLSVNGVRVPVGTMIASQSAIETGGPTKCKACAAVLVQSSTCAFCQRNAVDDHVDVSEIPLQDSATFLLNGNGSEQPAVSQMEDGPLPYVVFVIDVSGKIEFGQTSFAIYVLFFSQARCRPSAETQ